MKRLIHILLLLATTWLYACTGPIIIEEEENREEDTPQAKDTVLITHEGTFQSPYSIAEAQSLARGSDVWIEGYIVGSVKGSIKSGCNFTPQATIASNILLADTFPTGNNDDYQYCLPIELPNNTAERDDLNLYDNPENYHKKLRVQGNLTLYYSVVGMKGISDYSFEYDNDNGDDNEDEDEDEDNENDNDNKDENEENEEIIQDTIPENSKEYPLSIAEGIRLQSEDEYNQAWIRGYIIGYARSNNSVTYLDSVSTELTSKAKNNIVLADSIGERNNRKIIVVELPKGYLRDDVNLYENPHNLHRRLTVIGRMIPYYDMAGCKETLGTENRDRFLLE
ncbi:MAG: hypothetical protein IKY84_06670 [Bacteroidaceae bacterium]|nr:hypothetical protein [Bacteroidaceae bacterium]